MIKLVAFFLFSLCFFNTVSADELCVSEKKIKACILNNGEEWKLVKLYENENIVGVWGRLLDSSENPEVSIDDGRVNFLFFYPPSISGFSIDFKMRSKPYVNSIFKEFRVPSLGEEAVNSIVLSSAVDVNDGGREDFNLSERSLSLASVGKDVLVTSKKAFLRKGKIETSDKNPYVIYGDKVKLLSYSDGQLYVRYKAKNKFFEGWIYLSDLL